MKDRREELSLKFAKSCLKIEKFKRFFPLNKKDHVMSMRNSEKFALEKCSSVRYRDSALPYMKRLLNKYQSDKNKLFKAISVDFLDSFTAQNDRLIIGFPVVTEIFTFWPNLCPWQLFKEGYHQEILADFFKTP